MFVKAALAIEAPIIALENVPALLSEKFRPYLEQTVLGPLRRKYKLSIFELQQSGLAFRKCADAW